MRKDLKILTLDGGGSKGVYTLGVLYELEKMLGGKLHDHFDLIYGTSTGSIIAALIGLGESIEEIQKKYFELIPEIMAGYTRAEKSEKLKVKADTIFGDKLFTDFKTGIGIVAMNYDEQKPLIFKNAAAQAHGMKATFEPGFGCKISDAVQASCAAYPIFEIKTIETKNQGTIQAIDGGFVANNPTLFALIDAHKALSKAEGDIKLLSVGVGNYIEKPLGWKYKLLRRIKTVQFVERVLSGSSTTNEQLVKLLYPELKCIRINDTFNQPEFGTNLLEYDIEKLNKLKQLGRGSFAKHEKEIQNQFQKHE